MEAVQINPKENEKAFIFNELVSEVLKRRMRPVDKYEIAAILESMGWNDSMSEEVFGVEDVFALATNIWDAIQSSILFTTASPTEKISPLKYFLLIFKSFLRGTIFALPMAVSVASMLTLGFSLWSYEYLSLENATSIAIGTILSFMAIGGFTQAIARRGFMYLGQGHYYTARKIAFHFVKIGFVVCLLMDVLLLLFNSAFEVFPWRMTVIIILYFLFLSAIWLSVTIMYMLQKELVFTGLITGGIAVVFICFKLVKLDIILSQLIALTLVSVAGIIFAVYFFKRAEGKMEKGIAPALPRLSIIVYTSLPYFAYGFLYFTFLFCDRVFAWSTNNIYMPYLIWFRGEYELGLDFALIVMILPMGLVEVVVNEIMVKLEADQKNYLATDAKSMNEKHVSFYIKRMTYVVLFGLANAVVLYFVFKALGRSTIFERDVFSNYITHFVFIWAAIAYAIVTVALLNALILFCLSQPELVYRPMLVSLIVNMVLGFVLSRWVYYTWAVFGLFAGTIVFVFLTTRTVLKVLNNLDYYLYSAS